VVLELIPSPYNWWVPVPVDTVNLFIFAKPREINVAENQGG